MGNFTASNQPHIPPGLTDSPQADTARPAAREDFNTTCSLSLRTEGHRFTEPLDKVTVTEMLRYSETRNNSFAGME